MSANSYIPEGGVWSGKVDARFTRDDNDQSGRPLQRSEARRIDATVDALIRALEDHVSWHANHHASIHSAGAACRCPVVEESKALLAAVKS
jgi:hypothetical protein